MYGILRNSTNTGANSELISTFVAPISISSKRIRMSSDTLSLKRLSSSGKSQRWEIETNLISTDNSVEFFVNAIVNDLSEVIKVRMPQPIKTYSKSIGVTFIRDIFEVFPKSNPKRVLSGDLAFSTGTATSTSAIPNSDTITFTLQPEARLFVGDFVRFNGHSKVYLVKEIGVINELLHTVALKVFPNLLSSVAVDEVVSLGELATMNAVYDTESVIGMRYVDGILSDPGTVRLIEAL
jgi:hypothetical protein